MKKSNRPNKVIAASYYQGIIPKSSELEKYNCIIPNGADRIMIMAEKQQEHRHHLEKKSVACSNTDARIGLVFGFIITISFLVVSAYLILKGFETSGTILGTCDLVALAGVFVYGSKQKTKK